MINFEITHELSKALQALRKAEKASDTLEGKHSLAIADRIHNARRQVKATLALLEGGQ